MSYHPALRTVKDHRQNKRRTKRSVAARRWRPQVEGLEPRMLLAAEISGRVWNDLDANGLQDAGEPGVENTLVEIIRSTNTVIGDADDSRVATVATDASGNYLAVTGASGNFYARFLPPTGDGIGYRFTTADVGADDTIDSDAVPTLGRTNLLLPAGSAVFANVSAGLIAVPSDLAFAFGIGGPGNQQGRAVVSGADGSVYVGGRASGTTLDLDPGPGVANVTIQGGDDLFVAKYDADGHFVWGHSYGGTGNDSLESLALDGNGNLLFAGFFAGESNFGGQVLTAAGSRDAFVAKLDASGNLLWVRAISGATDVEGPPTAPTGDAAFGVTVDNLGGIYVTGQVTGTAVYDPDNGTLIPGGGTGPDIFALKVDGNGLLQWA